ncbi:MAG: TonB-dependent receptor plug domain-containing protein [Gammaproteobacteria bacterium]|nr:TonB-dependent receptor plug domain-containing protein [Gammaproteobacteria bacterium]
MKHRGNRFLFAFIAASPIALIPAGVAAQDDTADVAESEGTQRTLEEIVVTARKKEEDLLTVPIAITAFSADQLDRAGINSLAGVAAFTPGLTFSNLFGEFLPVPVIRGVAPTAIFGENNVAVFIDGVFVAGREGLNSSQLDLERIEVLKGPQSMKYGRNAFAGAINYVTARPGTELEGEAKIRVGNYDRRQARVTISGPLIREKLAGRISLGVDDWSGSYDNSLSNLDIGGYQYKTLQTSLWFTPNEAWDIQWAVYLSDDKIDDSARQTVTANCEDRQDLETEGIAPSPIPNNTPPPPLRDNPDYSDGPRPQNYCGTLAALPDNTLAINDQSTGEIRKLIRSSLNIDWATRFGTFDSLTGYSDTRQTARSDSNQTPDGAVPFYYLGTGGADQFAAELTTVGTGDDTVEWSQELRYSTPLENKVRGEIGAYWYDVEAVGGFTDFTARLADGSGQRLPADFVGLYPAPGVVGDAIFGPRFQNSVDDIVPPGEVAQDFLRDTESISGFAGLEIDFGKVWTADVGARYIRDKKRLRIVRRDPDNPTTDPDESRTFDYWTGRIALRAQVSDTNMFYSSIGNGKKGGGLDVIFGDLLVPNPNGGIDVVPVTRVTDFDIEELLAYEIGNKGTFWGDRARYDVALFYNDWTNILMPQILENDPVTGLPFEQPESVDLTGGDATTYGIETSLAMILTDHWDLSVGGSYTKAEYDDANLRSLRLFPSFWNDTNGDGVGDTADISGQELLRQSKWQGNATLNYIRQIRGEWEFYSRTDFLYQGPQWVGAANQAKVPEAAEVNQRFGFENNNLRLEFWVENLFDNDNPTAAFRDVTFNNTHLQIEPYGGFSDIFPFRMTVSHPKRRRYGVTLLVTF